MVLYKRLSLFQLALWVLILSLAAIPAMSASEELQVLKGKMTVLQDQIAREELLGKNLAIRESQLTKKIKLLKKDARTRSSLLSNLRIESLLKELRENLIIQQENENRRSLLEEQIIQTKTDLDSKMEVEINRLIESAREAFKTGDEARSDRSYQEALHLMEERKQFQTETIVLSPAPPPFGEFILDGKESLDKLREIADFAIHDLENIQKEIKLLEDNRNRIQEEIALRKNLVKYPGLLERGESNPPFQIESIEKELIQFEKKGKILENKLSQIQDSSKLLSRKVREIQRIIRQKEP